MAPLLIIIIIIITRDVTNGNVVQSMYNNVSALKNWPVKNITVKTQQNRLTVSAPNGPNKRTGRISAAN